MKACFESSERPPPSPESGGLDVLVCLAVGLGECVGSGSGQGRILKGFRTLFCWTSVCQQDEFIRDVATRERQEVFVREVVLKCLSVIFTQLFYSYLLNTYYVLCLVLGAGYLQQSTRESPVFMELTF